MTVNGKCVQCGTSYRIHGVPDDTPVELRCPQCQGVVEILHDSDAGDTVVATLSADCETVLVPAHRPAPEKQASDVESRS